MKIAVIYCRVSTDNQEREGTSLQTQLENCLKYCQDKGLDVAYRYSEAYSGLSLERPELDKLRELVRTEAIDIIVCYCLDRLSRDPGHGVILTQELEKHGVKLETVTEDVDNSELGKLISYIRGFASKLEAEKIRERTMRGKKARALQGKICAGSHARLYGYNYVKTRYDGGAVRVINEDQARWVKEMYRWLLEEGLSVNAITFRLRSHEVPTPSGEGYWIRSTVHNILANPAYMGKTYAFTQTYGEPIHRMKADSKRQKSGRILKPKSEWVEIPNATPVIISAEVFEAAQRQLHRNKELALRNAKRQYLIHGHVYCQRCGRSYWGKTSNWHRGDKHYERRYYGCSGNLKIVSPESCGSRNLNANELETVVWEQIETLLSQPALVLTELKRHKQETNQTNFLARDLVTLETRLEQIKKRDEKLFRGWLWGQNEEFIEKEKRALDKQKEALETERLELSKKIEAGKQSSLDPDKVEEACRLIRGNLKTLSFEDRRLILETLQIKVLVGDDGVRIEGCIPLPSLDIVSTQSGLQPPDPHF